MWYCHEHDNPLQANVDILALRPLPTLASSSAFFSPLIVGEKRKLIRWQAYWSRSRCLHLFSRSSPHFSQAICCECVRASVDGVRLRDFFL
ncbi:MAG: hypothetical protein KDA60_02140, partial [Planctomycetales bacterium]|nr:hypothetical protein [Planctomycetales bacterium]